MKSIAQLPLVGLIGTFTIIVGIIVPPAIIKTTVDKELLITYGFEKEQHGLLVLLSVKNGKSVYEILSIEALLNEPEGLSDLKNKFDKLIEGNCISVSKPVKDGFPELTGYNEGPTNYQIGEPQIYKIAVQNLGDVDSGQFNIKWFVDGSQVGHGSHNGVPKNETVNNDNDELIHTFNDAGPHLIQYLIDSENKVTESNEDDNRISFYVAESQQPEFLNKPCDDSVIEFNTIIALPYNKNSLIELIRIGV
ncbi:MAG: hypothetical protein HYS62_01220 [Candidatus Aenigmarchaeota archaeon]|nr:hypothetical protein [Candidatus Aenigmarchaeota archaeon]